MAFNFSRCEDVILRGILAGIELRADTIKRIAKRELVTGVSLDLVPWHRALGISIRRSEDADDARYCNTDWAHFDLVSNEVCPELQRAVDFVHEAYASEDSATEMAHMIFLAGAESILNERVAMAFSELGIEAPVCGDNFMPRPFEYMVFDFDETVRANYCELVLANRVTARWRPKLI